MFYVDHSSAFRLFFLNATETCIRNVRERSSACRFFVKCFLKRHYIASIWKLCKLRVNPSSGTPYKQISHFQNCILLLGPLRNLACKTRKLHFCDLLVIKKNFLVLYGEKKDKCVVFSLGYRKKRMRSSK